MFTQFLEETRKSDPDWFPKEDGTGTPTWLVDTGDRTTFGDDASLRTAAKYLEQWRRAARATASRELVGNHDAWSSCGPGMNVGTYKSDMVQSKDRLKRLATLDEKLWIDEPLRAPIPATNSEIQLYALDSIHWHGFGNVAARGYINPKSVERLCSRVTERFKVNPRRQFRILALHHPIVFPYDKSERRKGMFSVMALRSSNAITSLLNARDGNKVPMVNLFLSGHTHCRYPGQLLETVAVTQFEQHPLAPEQLQLVAGPLMYNTLLESENFNRGLQREWRAVDKFSGAMLDHATSQADLLRFLADPDQPGLLVLDRWQIAAPMGTEYIVIDDTRQRIIFRYDD
jgi:hypothetical protein